MAYTFDLFNSSGNLVFSSDDVGGIFVERLSIAVGSTSSKVYNTDSRFSGRVARAIQIGAGSHDWTVGTTSGYPSISWSPKDTGPTTKATALLVFVS